MIVFGGVGMAPVVMSPKQEARHCLLSCQPTTLLLMYRQIKAGWRDALLLHFNGNQTQTLWNAVSLMRLKTVFIKNLSQLYPALDVQN